MKFWIVDPRDNKPKQVEIDPERRADLAPHLRWIPELKMWLSEELLFLSMEDAARAHLKFLKKQLFQVDKQIEAYIKEAEGKKQNQEPMSLRELAQMELGRIENDRNFKKTKVPHLWIVK